MLSDYDLANLHYIMEGGGDWTSAKLLRFIREFAAYADGRNWARMQHAFPEHCAAYEWWYQHRADEGPCPQYLGGDCPNLVLPRR